MFEKISWLSKSRNYQLMSQIAMVLLDSDDEKERADGIKLKERLEKEGYGIGDYKPTVM
ncbi:hypothetical protein ABE273_22810 [Bacillus paranthracis]|uniref:hypothetical protein n=1 Tax=Bacillus paranthracis TaxID=2026186 RepID=UPI003734685D